MKNPAYYSVVKYTVVTLQNSELTRSSGFYKYKKGAKKSDKTHPFGFFAPFVLIFVTYQREPPP